MYTLMFGITSYINLTMSPYSSCNVKIIIRATWQKLCLQWGNLQPTLDWHPMQGKLLLISSCCRNGSCQCWLDNSTLGLVAASTVSFYCCTEGKFEEYSVLPGYINYDPLTHRRSKSCAKRNGLDQ